VERASWRLPCGHEQVLSHDHGLVYVGADGGSFVQGGCNGDGCVGQQC
jgi:hypothetical protein